MIITINVVSTLIFIIVVCYFAINRVLVGRLKKMIPAEVLKNRE